MRANSCQEADIYLRHKERVLCVMSISYISTDVILQTNKIHPILDFFNKILRIK